MNNNVLRSSRLAKLIKIMWNIFGALDLHPKQPCSFLLGHHDQIPPEVLASPIIRFQLGKLARRWWSKSSKSLWHDAPHTQCSTLPHLTIEEVVPKIFIQLAKVGIRILKGSVYGRLAERLLAMYCWCDLRYINQTSNNDLLIRET